MPAIFAHDLYGRDVYLDLKKEIQRVIKKEKDCFYLGLHGPDVLFFYRPISKNPINQKGSRYHERPAAEIFAHGLQVMRNEADPKKKAALQSYLLGFACHFALDHSLHGEIGELEETSGFTHAEIETELDRRLLLRANMNPVRTYTACHLKNTEMTRYVVMHILKEDQAHAKEAIQSFKWISRVFINTGEGFKRLLGAGMKLAGCYEKYYGMVMKKEPTPGLNDITDRLELGFLAAIPFGVELVEGLYESMMAREVLPDAFWGNFEGKKA